MTSSPAHRRPAVALMQPLFLPWLGFFALVDAADCFVYLDDFQFRRRSFHHRNRLFLSPGVTGWVTVPVEHQHRQARAGLNDVRPLLDDAVRRKFCQALQTSYGGAPHFEAVFELLREWVHSDWRSLADMNIAFIEEVIAMLGLSARTLRSSEAGSGGARSERLASILRRVGAASYLSARGSVEYMLQDGVFPLDDVDTFVQDYRPAPYRQTAGADDFVPSLSTVDVLMHCGAEGALEVLRAGSFPFVPWEEAALAAGGDRA